MLGLLAAVTLSWPQPTAEMKPWVYNWWMGSAVDEAGLRLQVDELEKSGFGGFHVIPIYSVKDNPNDRTMLSPDWRAVWNRAVQLAGEKGLGVDLTMGSGWCFGGPQLSPSEGSWMLQVTPDRKTFKPKGHPLAATVLWEGTDAEGKPRVLSTRPTGQQVKRSGPGGKGPMMNPFSPTAMADFLKPYTAAFDAAGTAKPLHFYHDSYEYYGAGWGPEFLAAFKARRGYDLADHLDALAGVGDPDTVARVKCDYRETLSDVLIDDVFTQWTRWCAQRGILTRNEAHGAPANLLDFYAIADVPETEMFGCDKARAQTPAVNASFLNSGDRDILVSKFASSAAHVKHVGEAVDPVVSSESCTWICEHFNETPGLIKTFVDRLLLSGVNHIFYHGMCYSPADAKWPGWTFYASSEMNRFNPLWREMKAVNAYVTRVQSIARTTAIDNDVLVYWPLHDYWMDARGFEKQLTVHDRAWLDGQPVGRIARKLHADGYAFDFISERQLQTLPARGRAGNPYTTIVVPGAKYMHPATLRRFYELAESGYAVLFVEGLPASVPGFKDVAAGEAELRRLAASRPSHVAVGSLDEVLKQAPARREPFTAAAGLMFTRHQKGGTTYYFLANQLRDEGVNGMFAPAVPTKSAARMDPWTGKIRPLPVEKGAVRIDLPIGHALILAVSSSAAEGKPAESASPVRPIALDGVWTRRAVAGGPEFPSDRSGKLPLAWGLEARGPEAVFSGTMRYETEFDLDRVSGSEAVLDLGRVCEAAHVYVNGVDAGVAIMAPWRVAFSAKLLKAGRNVVAVEVTSTGVNRLKALDTAKPYAWKVFTDINVVDINYRRLDASTWKARESGLYGPVVLELR